MVLQIPQIEVLVIDIDTPSPYQSYFWAITT